MFRKKGVIATVSTSCIFAGGVQNYLTCADGDSYDVLTKKEQEGLKELAEEVKFKLRLARDFTVAMSLALRMFEILRSRNKNEEKKIINILKEFSGETNNYENSEQSIRKLIDIIKTKSIKEKKEMSGEDLIRNLLNANVLKEVSVDEETQCTITRYKSFLQVTDILKVLLEYPNKGNDFIKTYRNYDFTMKAAVLKLKEETDPERIRTWCNFLIDSVEVYYSDPNGWIRFLATLGFYIDKTSFPGEENNFVNFQKERTLISLSCNAGATALTTALGVGVGCILSPVVPVSIPVAAVASTVFSPFFKKGTNKVKSTANYVLLNHDENLGFLSTTSNIDESSIFVLDKVYAKEAGTEMVSQVLGFFDPLSATIFDGAMLMYDTFSDV